MTCHRYDVVPQRSRTHLMLSPASMQDDITACTSANMPDCCDSEPYLGMDTHAVKKCKGHTLRKVAHAPRKHRLAR